MATVTETILRHQLEERRDRLHLAVHAGGGALEGLLREVDDALARMDAGTYGLCDVCHDTVEADRLLADPLCRLCLDHLTPEDRRSLERDLELAGQIQSALLPPPEWRQDGWELHARYLPAGPVSGDYYDVLPSAREGEGTLFVLADVSGKGVAASLLMSNLQAIFRSLSGTGLPLGELVARASRVFCESTLSSSYATLVAGRIQPSGTVEIANGGHCPPLLVHREGVECLGAGGLPIGLFCGATFPTVTRRLAPGDLLFLYTDGLSEAESPAGEEYGARRITAVLEGSRGLEGGAILSACLDGLARHQEGRRPSDDLTAMVIRRAAEDGAD